MKIHDCTIHWVCIIVSKRPGFTGCQAICSHDIDSDVVQRKTPLEELRLITE